jgi:hypothetical protein
MPACHHWSIGPAAWPAVLALVLLPGGLCLGQEDVTPEPGTRDPNEAKAAVPGSFQQWVNDQFQPRPMGAPVAAVGAPARPSEYWLGVVSEPVPEALRAHLNLRENEGLLVEDVAPDSPAAAAKIERYDIVLKAGGKAMTRVSDLIGVLDAAKGKKLPLEILRKGKPVTVEITPAKRPEGEISTLLRPAGPEAAETMRKWLERMRPGDAQGRDFNFYYVRPGVVVARPGAAAELPDNLTVSITRQGKNPAKITVTRGDQTWEIGEDNLDKLPADIRPHVERMLRHNMRGLLGPRMEGLLAPPAAPTPSPPAAKPGARSEKRREAGAPSGPPKPLEEKLEEMSRRLDEMHKAFEELKKKQSNLPSVREAIPAPQIEPPKSGASGK